MCGVEYKAPSHLLREELVGRPPHVVVGVPGPLEDVGEGEAGGPDTPDDGTADLGNT